ncbi:MAG: type II secretion system protein GspE, partial [Betaproteobacteria bacterium]|nr:type II secretion system protein GspE [Betaproteobacteria bacterium]
MAVQFPLPYGFAKSQRVLLEDDGRRRTLFISPRTGWPALSEVQRLHRCEALEEIDDEALDRRLAQAYAGGDSDAAAVVGEVESAVDLSRLLQDLPAVEDLLEAAHDAPIIRMLNALLTQAAKDGASDIHIEPYERASSVRFRVDGTLREVVQPNRALHAALISRLKIMAELDIAEKRLPQDGRISLRIGGHAVDVRVSTLPSAHGERAVLRLLDKGDAPLTLQALGMSGEVLAPFQRLVQQPHGIVLVTGPTGSGKTTTLYAALQTLDTRTTNVLTVEDPIEYEL